MNRRPSQSMTGYDSFSSRHTGRFTAATPDTRFFDPQKKLPFFRCVLRLLLYLLLAVLAGNFVLNQFVHVDRVEVPVRGLSLDLDGYTILHISDLKGASFGNHDQLLLLSLGQAEYDAVVFSGDMVSSRGNAQPLYTLIEALIGHDPGAPIYFIPGDGDPPVTSERYFSGGSPFAPWVLGAQQRGAKLLSAPVNLAPKGPALWLMPGGTLTLDVNTMQGQYEQQYLRALSSGDDNAIELAAYNLRTLEDTRQSRTQSANGDPVIVLTHAPPREDDPGVASAHLVLCGHYLGGLIRLPLLGPLFVPAQHLPRYGILPGRDTFSGLSRQGSTWVYSNAGLGASAGEYPPLFFRLFNPPTVALITLTASTM